MSINHRWIVALLFVVCLPLTSCKKAAAVADADEEKEIKPAIVDHLKGSEPTRVTLTDEAAKRLDIQTAPVADTQLAGQQRKVIPYASVLYDTQGDAWTWIKTAPLVFVRHPIAIDQIEGDKVVLSKGPDTGAQVVTVGAAELYGSEMEFEEE
jgi:hypothetical protein